MHIIPCKSGLIALLKCYLLCNNYNNDLFDDHLSEYDNTQCNICQEGKRKKMQLKGQIGYNLSITSSFYYK